ncbi:MAG: phosphate signaling complex protein PhoU [Oscillospiraceae bacterium]|nr:phosphate signaling complex protein PhoU [Oscillospiraceae bacterium]
MAVRKAYQGQLQTLHDELTEMGSLCTQAVQLAVRAVTTGDEQVAQQTWEADGIVDKKERDVESLCLKILLQQQPVAADLRRISSALKMVSDLERIGDQAADIAEISREIVIREGKAADDLQAMAQETVRMVNESVAAFTRNDLVLARQVISMDDGVDDWFRRIKNDLVSAIAADSTEAEYFVEILMTAKYLEKIGDHAVNVAEWVEYSIVGYRSDNGPAPDP